MRWIVAEVFSSIVESREISVSSVAVVGGSNDDPEIQWVRRRFPEARIDFFGVDDPHDGIFHFMDLNLAWDGVVEYDLVHCAQVLEHLWDVRQAISTLLGLCKSGGLVWINCPASCFAHGSPLFYSAGYQPGLISKLAVSLGAEVVEAGRVGSCRAYFYEHCLRRWPDRDEYEAPITHMTGWNVGRGGRARALLRWLKYLPQRALAVFFSSGTSARIETATQSWVALTRT